MKVKVKRVNDNLQIGQTRSYKTMPCKLCGDLVNKVDYDAAFVTCSHCVQKAVGPPEEYKKYEKSDNPRGWKLYKVFVDKNLNVYHRGELQPQLKGTLQQTIIEKQTKIKQTKQEKLENENELLIELNAKRKQILLVKTKTESVKLSRQISKLQKKIKKIRGY